MIAEVLKRKNLYAACQQVVRNKGAAVYGLGNHLEANRDKIITEVLSKPILSLVLGISLGLNF